MGAACTRLPAPDYGWTSNDATNRSVTPNPGTGTVVAVWYPRRMTRALAAALPDFAVVAALPSYFDQQVPAEYVDLNGHMNINHYFSLGAWGPWKRMAELGMPEDYMVTGS